MHGPSLTPREVAAVLQGNIARLISLGIAPEAAVRAVACDHGVAPARVACLIDRYRLAVDGPDPKEDGNA